MGTLGVAHLHLVLEPGDEKGAGGRVLVDLIFQAAASKAHGHHQGLNDQGANEPNVPQVSRSQVFHLVTFWGSGQVFCSKREKYQQKCPRKT